MIRKSSNTCEISESSLISFGVRAIIDEISSSEALHGSQMTSLQRLHRHQEHLRNVSDLFDVSSILKIYLYINQFEIICSYLITLTSRQSSITCEISESSLISFGVRAIIVETSSSESSLFSLRSPVGRACQ